MSTIFSKRLRAVGSLLLIVVALACGRRTSPGESTGSQTALTPRSTMAPPPGPSLADLAALNQIVLHHEQTVALAQRAAGRTVHPELREFVEGVLRDRRQEIAELRRLGATSTAAVEAAPPVDDTPNETLDVLFVTTLAAHEENGRAMASQILATTTHKDVKSFAEGLVNKAGSELTQLNLWKQKWSSTGHQDDDDKSPNGSASDSRKEGFK